YGKYYWTFDASRYKVQKAATSIAFSETAVSVDKAETPSRTLTITQGPSDSDDWVLLSTDNARVVSLSTPNLDLSKGKTVTLTFLGTGTATITARSLVGNSEKTCTVTVTSSIASEHVYLDEKLQKAADGTAFAYANGSTKKTGNMSVNYKASVLYTDLLVPVYKTAKGKATGKILVGLTTEMQEPVVKDNKVAKDAAANQLASVSYKKFTTESKETIGKITVTAKKPGTVYAWIFALTTKDNIQTVGYAPVTLKPAPTKVIFQNTPCVSGEANSTFGTVTSRMAAIGTPFDIYLNPTVAVVQKIRQTVTENTFSLSVPDASKSYIKVEKKAGSQYGYTITPLALKDGKKTKVVLKAVCGENTTNAKLTVTITNSVKKMNFAKLDSTEDSFTVTDVANQSLKVKIAASAGLFARTAKLKETVTLYDSSAANLDGTKIYQIPSATGFTVANAGNVTVEKGITAERKKVSMKLVKGTTDEYQITVNAGFGDGQTAYLLVVHNGLAGQGAGWRVIEVTVGASGIKGNENPIWANAKDTELKKTKVNTSLAPTAYTSGRKTVYGKLVWICRQEKKDPEFNASTHKVTTKSDSKVASVNADGVVTAKAGGTAYVYAVDTGTGNFDLIEVPVKDTPLDIRMYKAASADPTKGDAEYKKETVAQGGKVDVYVQGTVGSVRAGTMKVLTGSGYDYTYSVADSQKDYVSVTQDGAHFTVNVAADAWTKAGLTGNKKLSIKVNFICVKNGKKGTFTLSVTKG
ncbi:MAG: hypothetical protein IJ733_05050, partial [Lachnospiraceae bacterium]|nr:hypothetical protein [Lachnospiraceae bacterium]